MSEYEDFLQRNYSTDGLIFTYLLDKPMSIRKELEESTGEKIKNNIKDINRIINDVYDPSANDSDREDYDTVNVVLIPKDKIENKNSIYSWNLEKFTPYKKIDLKYGEGNTYDFNPPLGYKKILLNEIHEFRGSKCVWELSSFKNKYLVNFEPFGYECFVEKIHNPLQIPYILYQQIFIAYGYRLEDFPSLKKKEMFELIIKGNKYKSFGEYE